MRTATSGSDPRKAALLEKYTKKVEQACRRTKNSAKHMHTRRMAMVTISSDLAAFYAQELCTHLLTAEETSAITEEMLNKYGLNN